MFQKSTQLGLANIKKRYTHYTVQSVIVKETNLFFVVNMPILPEQIIENRDVT